MILGIGVDIVKIARIKKSLARFGDRFAEKILSQRELAVYEGVANQAAYLAKRFAAKEALSKALGTGMSGGVYFSQISVINDTKGAPQLELAGAALLRAEQLGAAKLLVSLSDEVDSAIAFVVLES